MRRSKLLKASRFGDFLHRTMSWWRSATISASREARDLKSPITTHQISSSISPMRRSIARFATLRQLDKVYDKDTSPWNENGSNETQSNTAAATSIERCIKSTSDKPRFSLNYAVFYLT